MGRPAKTNKRTLFHTPRMHKARAKPLRAHAKATDITSTCRTNHCCYHPTPAVNLICASLSDFRTLSSLSVCLSFTRHEGHYRSLSFFSRGSSSAQPKGRRVCYALRADSRTGN